ncbi:MAG TPA: helix-turn-helix domain-containing protein [Petrimonas sp.]|jgi:excisionase family DNA binding protein|nr:helix-turn-helix domain-containing protein [Petrimonas sp.]
MNQRLMTASQTAKMLNISKHRLYDLAKRGIVPHVRLGRQVRFDTKQIDAWLEHGGTQLENRRVPTLREE